MLDLPEALLLLDYDRWATDRIGERLAAAPEPLPAANRLLTHLVGASAIWLARVRGTDATGMPVWPEPMPLPAALARSRELNAGWREVVAAATDFARVVRFANAAGTPCADRFDDILRHLVNHGTHHRAQIASLLRGIGVAPDPLDFIVFRRLGAGGGGR